MPTLFASMEDVIAPDREYSSGRARVLAWVSGLLALPGGLAACVGWFLGFPLVLFVFGVYLLVGYTREAGGHPRGRRFWIASLVFNALLWVATSLALVILVANREEVVEQVLLSILLMVWQAAAMRFSWEAALVATEARPAAKKP